MRNATVTFTLLQIIVPAAVALVVVALGHLFTTHRDRINKQREQRIFYLVSVFRALSKANNHPHLYEVADDLEQAIADIQLFGTPKQVELAQKFATELGKQQEAEMNQLLLELRENLRSELGAKPLPGRIVWLRVRKKEGPLSDHEQ